MSVHGHQRPASGGQRELCIALLLTLAMMVIEFVAGWLSGSLALLADAGHMLTDASALVLSLFAAWFATRPATLQKTYGYYRTEILAGLANGVALWLIVIWIYARAFNRLQHPLNIPSGPMIVVALLGLLVNLLSGWILTKGRARSLNVQGAWLNVMSDALGSLGVIVAGVMIQWYGWTAADPIASMVIGVLIAFNSWNLVKQSVNILLEGTPGHLRIPEVVQAMRAIPGVHEVHDVHLWTITTGMDAMSGHVIVEDVGQSAAILLKLNALLSQRFGITHTTFQLEPRQHVCQMGSETPRKGSDI
jgi:cobalt-zinc-cadmium efflux system protein